jgi:uncharacterized protein involved in tolerance to divalent cations
MSQPGSAVVVLTTLGIVTDAVELARTLVEEGLAACVNVLPPMESVYRWKGAVEVDTEQQLVIKTTPGVSVCRGAAAYTSMSFPSSWCWRGRQRDHLRWVGDSVEDA